MIRVKIELVPDGINQLAEEGERIIIACRFPIDDPEHQALYLFSEANKGYAEIESYDLEHTIYKPADGKPKYLELVRDAITALLEQDTYREGGEFFPGMMGLTPTEFDAKMAEMVQQCKHIESIRIFGRRIKERVEFGPTPDIKLLLDDNTRKTGVMDGHFLLANYPRYIQYDIAIRLDPWLYQQPWTTPIEGTDISNYGELLELSLQRTYGLREHPHVRDMNCQNGIIFFFLRPDGRVTGKLAAVDLTKRKDCKYSMGVFETDYTLETIKQDIKAGNLIYSKREGLTPYPGKP